MRTRILVAEDERDLRAVIVQVLREDGYEVVEASTAEEALERYQEEAFSLVITDIVMGEMNGLDLLREIKRSDAEALVVLMTSHASLETEIEALRAGAYDFLRKPFDEIELVSAVAARAVERQKLIRENQELLRRLRYQAAELDAVNTQLRAMAHRDGLTGLYNHRFFREALEIEISRASRYERQFSLIFLDIDHFKKYNDSHGHLVGDALLKALAHELLESSRKSDTVARYGGEEFVLLLSETARDGAMQFANRLRENVAAREFVDHDGDPLGQVTISVGVSCYPDHATEANALIELADRALYCAKRSGRNFTICWDEIERKEPAPA